VGYFLIVTMRLSAASSGNSPLFCVLGQPAEQHGSPAPVLSVGGSVSTADHARKRDRRVTERKCYS
jgi:hypothetical protein